MAIKELENIYIYIYIYIVCPGWTYIFLVSFDFTHTHTHICVCMRRTITWFVWIGGREYVLRFVPFLLDIYHEIIPCCVVVHDGIRLGIVSIEKGFTIIDQFNVPVLLNCSCMFMCSSFAHPNLCIHACSYGNTIPTIYFWSGPQVFKLIGVGPNLSKSSIK